MVTQEESGLKNRMAILIIVILVSLVTECSIPTRNMHTKSIPNPSETHALWNQTYGGQDTEIGCSLVECDDSGFAIAGYSQSYGGMYLCRTDENGNLVWNKTFSHPRPAIGIEIANSILKCEDGGFALGGRRGGDTWLIRTNSTGHDLWNTTFRYQWGVTTCNTMSGHPDGGFVLAGTAPSMGWIAYFNELGYNVWNHTYGTYLKVISSIVERDNDGFYACGRDYHGDDSTIGALMCLNNSGGVIWNRTYSENIPLYSITECSNGDVVMLGEEGQRAYFYRIDSNGNLLQSQEYLNVSKIGSIIQCSDGGFAFSAQYQYPWDLMLVRTDNSGNLLWRSRYGGGSPDFQTISQYNDKNIIECSNGGFALLGNRYDSNHLEDIWLLRIPDEAPMTTGTTTISSTTTSSSTTTPTYPIGSWDFSILIIAGASVAVVLIVVLVIKFRK